MPVTRMPLILSVFLMPWLMVSAGNANVTTKHEIGQVTMIIGQSYATGADGDKRRLKQASGIFVGDRIETNGGAHVHIRFIDEGRISVRPESRLYIKKYHTDEKNPANNVIRFYLEQGVLRSISGKATEAAHDRYRLNTPIAALGVLGTDYVIRTTDKSTWAAVYSGGIALAPIGGGCDQGALGICANAIALTAEMNGKYLEINAGDIKPKIKSQLDQINQDIPLIQPQNSTDSEDQTPAIDNTDNTDNTRVTPSEGDNELASKEQLALVDVPAQTLVWGRWPWHAAHKEDNLSQNLQTASENRNITIANSYAGLFRAPSDVFEHQLQNGSYDFNLQRSHVVFIQPGQSWQQAEQAKLNNASLSVDFGSKQFNTQLEMAHEKTGEVQLNVQGNLNNNGIFTGKTTDGRVAGALSADGKQAGMLFDKTLTNGQFSGITEWQR